MLSCAVVLGVVCCFLVLVVGVCAVLVCFCVCFVCFCAGCFGRLRTFISDMELQNIVVPLDNVDPEKATMNAICA